MDWTEIVGRIFQYVACFAIGFSVASNRIHRRLSRKDAPPMPPTDPVIEFLDELQRLAETMPEGPYLPNGYNFNPERKLRFPTINQMHGPYMEIVPLCEEEHSRYFAALDRDIVLALVRVVEAAGVLDQCDGTLLLTERQDYAAYEVAQQAHSEAVTKVVNAAMDFRELAADRVAS